MKCAQLFLLLITLGTTSVLTAQVDVLDGQVGINTGTEGPGKDVHMRGSEYLFQDKASLDVRMYIDADGKVGIGTIAPQEKIDIHGNIAITHSLNGGQGDGTSDYGDIYSKLLFRTSDADNHISSNKAHAWIQAVHLRAGSNHLAADAGLQFVTTDPSNYGGAVRMTITNDGKVGIGTETPKNTLDVSSTNKVVAQFKTKATSGADAEIVVQGARNGSTTTDVASLSLNNFDNNEYSNELYTLGKIAAGMQSVSGNKGYLSFKTNEGNNLTEKVRITSEGKVGIGIVDPTAKLDVDGKTKTTALQVTTDAGAGKVLQSDADGNASWVESSSLAVTGDDMGNHTATQNINLGTNKIIFTNNNTRIGSSSGNSITTGKYNNFIGNSAGRDNTAGTYNNFLGYATGAINTTGNNNNFLGYLAGNKNTTGNGNNFLGNQAGRFNTTGGHNTFIGTTAGYKNTTGTYNNFIGYQSGYTNTTGTYNTFIGYRAGRFNTTGINNTFIGKNAGYTNVVGRDNLFVGTSAGFNNTTGHYNAFIGYTAGYANTTGSHNYYTGREAGRLNTTGNYNIAIGYKALYNNLNQHGNIALGYSTGYETTGGYNTLLGYNTGRGITTGTNNTIIGGRVNGLSPTLSNHIILADGEGNQRIVADEVGNVGIGTTSPSQKLDVAGKTKTTNLQVTADAGAGKVLQSDADGNASWVDPTSLSVTGDNLGSHSASQNIKLNGKWLSGDGGNEGVAISNTGNVGIGISPPSTIAKLHVAGAIKTNRSGLYGTYNSAQVQGIWSISENYKIDPTANTFGTQYGMTYAHTNAGTTGEKKPIAGWGHQILFTNSGNRNAAISLSSGNGYFKGNVGIGTTAPQNKLDIEGTYGNQFRIKGVENSDQETLLLGTGKTATGVRKENMAIYTSTGSSSGGHAFYAGNQTDSKLWIDRTGNIGIGTEEPETNLHLQTPQSAILKLEADTDNTDETDHPQIQLSQDGGSVTGLVGFYGGTNHLKISNNWNSDDADIEFQTGTTTKMTIDGTGNVGIGTSTPSHRLVIHNNVPNNSTFIDDRSIKFSRASEGYKTAGLIYDGQSVLTLKSGGGGGVISFGSNFDGDNKEAGRIVNGRLGMGVTVPEQKLHIGGNATFGKSDGTSGQLFLYGSTAGKYSRMFTSNGNLHIDAGFGTGGDKGMYLNYYNGSNIYFGNGASGHHSYALSNGNWKIGGALQLAGYTGSNHNGTPTHMLGVDASGNVVKIDKTAAFNPIVATNTNERQPGEIRWTGEDFEGWDGTRWRSFTAGSETCNQNISTDAQIYNSAGRGSYITQHSAFTKPLGSNEAILIDLPEARTMKTFHIDLYRFSGGITNGNFKVYYSEEEIPETSTMTQLDNAGIESVALNSNHYDANNAGEYEISFSATNYVKHLKVFNLSGTTLNIHGVSLIGCKKDFILKSQDNTSNSKEIDQLTKKVESQSQEIETLKILVDALLEEKVAGINRVEVTLENAVELETPYLSQNIPNPTSNDAIIKYYVPEDASEAMIRFYSLSGQVLKEVNINQMGQGELKVDLQKMISGNYIYNLIVDGEMIDTKTMVIVK